MKQKFVIMHKENKSFYQKTIFKNQRHFVKQVDYARMMTFKQAFNIWEKLNDKEKYVIKEVKVWKK